MSKETELMYAKKSGFTEEQLKTLSNENLDLKQMREIRWGFLHGLSDSQVALYAKPEFSQEQMALLRNTLEVEEDAGYVPVLANTKFNYEQMSVLQTMVREGCTMEELEYVAKPCFSVGQMKEIAIGMFGDVGQEKLSRKQIDVYADEKFTPAQMRQIRWGFSKGFTEEQVKVYADEAYTAEQMEMIRLGLRNGLPEKLLTLYTNPAFSPMQMHAILLGYEDCGIISDCSFDKETGTKITWDFNENPTKEKILMFAKPELPLSEMEQIRDEMVKEIGSTYIQNAKKIRENFK